MTLRLGASEYVSCQRVGVKEGLEMIHSDPLILWLKPLEIEELALDPGFAYQNLRFLSDSSGRHTGLHFPSVV